MTRNKSHFWPISILTTNVACYIFVAFLNVISYGETRYADIAEFPYHVSIQKSGKHACSGAFMHESWIITTAACVFNIGVASVTVRVRSSTFSGGDVLNVNQVIIHEDFDKYVHHNDIALLKLQIPAEYGEKLLPIGLPEGKDYVFTDGTACFVTGWRPNSDDPAESRLAVTAVPLINQTTCISAMPSYAPVTEKMVCAGNMNHGVETCQGDPGAPLTTDWTLIGILSYGLGCDTTIHPGVYTRINSYLSWISSNTGISYA